MAENISTGFSGKLVFLVGCPRSGTTWLMWLLAQHSSVVACNHTALFHALRPLKAWWQDEVGYGKSIYAKNEGGFNTTESDSFSKTNLNSILSLDEFYKFSGQLGMEVFTNIANCGNETKVVVDKTPENLQFSDWILKSFPEAHILHIIRDPRSVFASNCNAVYSWADPREFPTNPIQAAKRWRHYIELGRQTKELTSRYKEVFYEALLENGEAELGQVFAWLGLTAKPGFYQNALENSTIDKLRNKNGLAPKGFFQKGKNTAWVEELSASEIKVIEYVAGEYMQELGYELKYGSNPGKPLRCWTYEIGSKSLQKLVKGPLFLLWKLVQGIPGIRQFQPRKRILALKRTFRGMLK